MVTINEVLYTAFLGMVGWLLVAFAGYGINWLVLAVKSKKVNLERLRHKEKLLDKGLKDLEKLQETYVKLIEDIEFRNTDDDGSPRTH